MPEDSKKPKAVAVQRLFFFRLYGDNTFDNIFSEMTVIQQKCFTRHGRVFLL